MVCLSVSDMDYRCYYCKAEIQNFHDAISHCAEIHENHPLIIRIKCLNELNGKLSFIAKKYDIIPSEVKSRGLIINADDNDCVTLTHDKNGYEAKETDTCTTRTPCVSESPLKDDTSNERLDFVKSRLQELAPDVAESMQRNNNLENWLELHELVAANEFPFYNICFKLFMDVVRFLRSKGSITYSNDTKLFWYIGFKLFHGRFLRFMGGPRNRGIKSLDENTPNAPKINFCVPNLDYLSQTQSIMDKEVKPGILNKCLEFMSNVGA